MPNMVKKEPPTGGNFNSSYTHREILVRFGGPVQLLDN